MRLHIAVWWIALAGAVVGLLCFLVGPAVEVGDGWLTSAPGMRTGAQMLAHGIADGCERLGAIVDEYSGVRVVPDVNIWLLIAFLAATMVPLALRAEPTRRARLVLAAVTAAVFIPTMTVVVGIVRTPSDKFGPAIWIGVGALLLLCLAPWLRRKDQIVAVAAWNARPGKPEANPPPLDELPAELAGIVHQTRSLRGALNVLRGVDTETTLLVWEWQRSVEGCGVSEAALLSELGLGSAAIAATISAEGRSDTESLLELDKALSTFEHRLSTYRSFGFR